MLKFFKIIIVIAIAGLSLIGLFAIFPDTIEPSHFNSNIAELHFAKPNDKDFFDLAYNFVNENGNYSEKQIVAGIIPHHLLAADLIADFFHNLEGKNYDAVILLGPNHFMAGQSDIITSAYDWQTPYGILESDDFLLDKLLDVKSLDINIEEGAMEGEHSINSEVSFIKKTFPEAKFIPLILKPVVSQETAEKLAEVLFEISKEKNILVLASVDFSHYKTSEEAQEDDKKSIAAISDFDFSDIYNLEVDSPPSIYTILKFSQLNGASFDLLANSNSAILSNKPNLESTTSYVTGYFLPQDISMLFVGDIMLDRWVKTLIDKDGLGYILGNLQNSDFFQGYDLIGANLEGAVTGNGLYYEPVKEFDFAFDPQVVFQLENYGFNFFNLANNHFADQGERGMEETRKNLIQLGFHFSGCQDGLISEDCSFTILSVKGKKIAMLGLSMVGASLDLEKAEKIINSLQDKTDFIIANIHWGQEYDSAANKNQIKIAHKLIDCGVDAIIGHHPHVVQNIEVYKSKPIFYSLGNFIFDQYFSSETQKGLAVSLDFSGDKINYAIYHVDSLNGQLSLDGR